LKDGFYVMRSRWKNC